MARRRVQNGIALNADLSNLAKVHGALEAMSTTVKTDRFLTPIVESTHVTLSNRFDTHMDMLAESVPNMFHHVYEWRLVGDAAGRLWSHQLKGRGSSNRYSSWAWRASKTPILSPQERAGNPSDPMSDLSDDQIDSFNDRKYIFQWKAPVMEYNMAVNIKPRYGKQIAFPSSVSPGTIVGVSEAIVENPGGPATTLAFTKEWTRWWTQEAKALYESEIADTIKSGIESATIAAVKKGSRSATMTTHNMTYEAAKKQGEKWARENLHKFANSKATEADWFDPEGGL